MVHPVSLTEPSLRVLPNRESWSQINTWLQHHITALAIPEPCAYALRLALEELFLNTISYGCSTSQGSFVQVSIQHHRDHILLIIEDDARPFNPLTAPLPCPDNGPPDREGGLGLLLARQMLTSLDYEPLPNGNRLILKKQLGQSTH
ncbi:MAG: ATP-binding protein [Verrucomicrobiia bacterium]